MCQRQVNSKLTIWQNVNVQNVSLTKLQHAVIYTLVFAEYAGLRRDLVILE